MTIKYIAQMLNPTLTVVIKEAGKHVLDGYLDETTAKEIAHSNKPFYQTQIKDFEFKQRYLVIEV